MGKGISIKLIKKKKWGCLPLIMGMAGVIFIVIILIVR